MITHIILFAYGWTALFGFGIASLAPEQAEPATAETRCGWFENPTPANAWLVDREGEWTIAVQGGYQAEGDWPDFKNDQWVKTNINYGYGCACMKVTTDIADKRILTIHSATAKPLSTCRKDKAIKKKEPKWDS